MGPKTPSVSTEDVSATARRKNQRYNRQTGQPRAGSQVLQARVRYPAPPKRRHLGSFAKRVALPLEAPPLHVGQAK